MGGGGISGSVISPKVVFLITSSLRLFWQLPIEIIVSQTCFLKAAFPQFWKFPILICLPASLTAWFKEDEMKNTTASSRIANINEKKGIASMANSIAVAPSSERLYPLKRLRVKW